MHVSALNYYPIKSCRGTRLEEAALDRRGIVGDRSLMLVDAAGKFMTQRTHPRLALVTPTLNDGTVTLGAPGMAEMTLEVLRSGPRVGVAVWDDECLGVDQGDAVAAWLGDFLGVACRLLRMADDFVRPVEAGFARGGGDQVGFADAYPLLLISEASLADLNSRLAEPVAMNRFRPNLVVSGCGPYAEDGWRTIRVGGVTFTAAKPCARCVLTTVNQETGGQGKEPLKTLAAYRNAPGQGVLFGQNLLHHGAGVLRLGDAVEVLERR